MTGSRSSEDVVQLPQDDLSQGDPERCDKSRGKNHITLNLAPQRQDTTMTFIVTMFRDEDGVFVVECPAIPGCISQGATESEAISNIRDAVRECLEVRRELSLPLTIEVRQVEIAV